MKKRRIKWNRVFLTFFVIFLFVYVTYSIVASILYESICYGCSEKELKSRVLIESFEENTQLIILEKNYFDKVYFLLYNNKTMSRNYEIKFRCIRTSYNTCVGFTLCDVGEYKGYCMDDGFKMWLEQDKIHLNGEQYIISSINYEKPTGLSRYKFYMMVDYIAFEYARMPVEIT